MQQVSWSCDRQHITLIFASFSLNLDLTRNRNQARVLHVDGLNPEQSSATSHSPHSPVVRRAMLESSALSSLIERKSQIWLFAKFFCLVAQSDQTMKASLIMILAWFFGLLTLTAHISQLWMRSWLKVGIYVAEGMWRKEEKVVKFIIINCELSSSI